MSVSMAARAAGVHALRRLLYPFLYPTLAPSASHGFGAQRPSIQV
ncbi:MAG TPA: hypothetical protein VED85_05920 [Burkholderiaceae bacterium]|nr:hypothetical protein [Burkholderiaceae bacterium]